MRWLLVLALVLPLKAAEVAGSVVDPQGAAVPQALVELLSPRGAVERSIRTDEQGRFRLEKVERGSHELRAGAPGFESRGQAVRIDSSAAAIHLQLRLALAPVAESVTVTTAPGSVESLRETPQPVNVISASVLAERRAGLLPQAFRDEVGLHVQQTTAHQGSVLVRGLTGQHVVTLVDGVRFNNATFRPGPNQYQGLIDASTMDRVEVVRGPGSVQYGSDSLGGAINVITRRDLLSRGKLSTYVGSSDLSGGSELQTAVQFGPTAATFTGFGKRVNDLRPGGAADSHAAVTRFLGLPSTVLGGRLQDTAFTAFGGSARVAAQLVPQQTLSLYYTRGQQQGGRRYDQLNGGNGNLQAGYDPQVLDFFYARYERPGMAWLDWLSATASFNRIRDDRQTQSGNPMSAVTYDFARTDAFGYQAQATAHAGQHNVIGFGGEIFDEKVRSRLHRLDPVTGIASGPLRARFPQGAAYQTSAGWLQDTVELQPNRWRATGGLRYGTFRYRDDVGTSLRTGDLTYHAGTSYFLTSALSLHGVVSRGFRAPNITDLSQIGLTSNGFEVSPAEAARLGAPVRPLRPESLLNYEGGVRFSTGRASAEVTYFVADIHDLISKRALLLPPGAVGQVIGGERILFQDAAEGWVRVAVDARPVVTRANFSEVRISGLEFTQRLRVGSAWTLQGNLFALRGRDAAGAPPEIEGGLPPATGYASLRYHRGSRWWIEVASNLAWRQDRLSSLELADQRIGAVRTRASIASFFNNGALARGLVAGGRLVATGETLAQVQDRVLGPGVNSAPWYRATPGYSIFHFRGGVQLTERSTIGFLVDNLLDKNYRTHGSGIDGPGLHFQARYTVRF